MKKIKVLLASITALSFLCAGCLPITEQIPPIYSIFASAEDEEIVTSGICGENLTWEFDQETGILTISGTGTMKNWYLGNYPEWYGLRENIKKVILEDNVTTIGNYSFCECTALESITIPDSVTAIKSLAFEGCSALESVTISDSVTSIGNYAFMWCKSLTSVTIPNSVTGVGERAFSQCGALTSITIENPECKIFDDETTISDTATIYGYENSTAQAYAEKYHKNFIPLGTAPEILIGDADKDGEFNILDIIVLQKWLLGSGNLPNWKAVDFNQDGMINIFDLVLAKKYYLENLS